MSEQAGQKPGAESLPYTSSKPVSIVALDSHESQRGVTLEKVLA